MGGWIVRPCIRCGIRREVRPDRQRGLCRDCRYTLSKEEKQIWAA